MDSNLEDKQQKVIQLLMLQGGEEAAELACEYIGVLKDIVQVVLVL